MSDPDFSEAKVRDAALDVIEKAQRMSEDYEDWYPVEDGSVAAALRDALATWDALNIIGPLGQEKNVDIFRTAARTTQEVVGGHKAISGESPGGERGGDDSAG